MPLKSGTIPRTLSITPVRIPRKINHHVINSNNNNVVFIPYTPIKKAPAYELRLLQSYPVAITQYQRRDEGFLLLGNYLSGSNSTQIRCKETQPIVMTYYSNGTKTMQVYIVPKEDSKSEDMIQLPTPIDPSVKLDAGGGEIIASLRFEGNATQEACEKARKQLLDALQSDGLNLIDLETQGLFKLAQYGPLHSLSTRINEIWLSIKV